MKRTTFASILLFFALVITPLISGCYPEGYNIKWYKMKTPYSQLIKEGKHDEALNYYLLEFEDARQQGRHAPQVQIASWIIDIYLKQKEYAKVIEYGEMGLKAADEALRRGPDEPDEDIWEYSFEMAQGRKYHNDDWAKDQRIEWYLLGKRMILYHCCPE